MSEHPIQGLMTTALESLKDMIDVNTIIGDPIETPDGSTLILTVSKVGFGFAAGGSQFQTGKSSEKDNKNGGKESQGQGHEEGGELPFGGGSGGGVSITPIAFLIVNKTSGVKMIHLDENTHLYERILDLAPQTVQKIQEVLNKNSKKDRSSKDGQQQQSQQQSGEQNNQNFSW